MNKTPDLRKLLVEADREFQPLASSRPDVKINTLEVRARRQQLNRAMTCTVGFVLVAAVATLSWRSVSTKSRITSPTLVSIELSSELLKKQAENAAQAGKAWQHERTSQALRSKYRKLRREAVAAEVVSPLEQAARMNLTLAQELERRFGAGDFVVMEYRRVMARFPDTPSARVASERLKLIDSST